MLLAPLLVLWLGSLSAEPTAATDPLLPAAPPEVPPSCPVLEDHGLAYEFGAIFDTTPTPRGISGRARADRVLFTAGVKADLEAMWGLEGASAHVQLYSQSGRNGSSIAGDLQGYSNIDNDNVAQLSELWYQQELWDGSVRLKVGKVDANSEFAAVEAGSEFLHSSAGFSPTIHAFPSYPDPAVSLNAFVALPAGSFASLGVYNAEDGGAVSGRRGMAAEFEERFLIGELGLAWGTVDEANAGRAGIGGWRHTGDFDRFDGDREDGTGGTYAFLEQQVLGASASGFGGLTLFGQVGVADEDVSEVERHLALGGLCTGLLPDREDEFTGLYVSTVELSEVPGSGLSGRETAIELFHAFHVNDWFTIKPDVQLVVDPSGGDAEDILIATLRLELY